MLMNNCFMKCVIVVLCVVMFVCFVVGCGEEKKEVILIFLNVMYIV